MKIAIIFNTLSMLLIAVYLITWSQNVQMVCLDMPRPKPKPAMIIRNGEPVFMGNILDTED